MSGHCSLITDHRSLLLAAEFGENAEGALGVEETDVETFSAATSLLVDKAYALFFSILQSLVGVFHAESDMVHTALAAVLFDERSDGAFGAGRFEKFNLNLAAFEESGLHFLVFHFLDSVAFKAHNVFVITDSLFEVGNSDTDVFNMRRSHN